MDPFQSFMVVFQAISFLKGRLKFEKKLEKEKFENTLGFNF